MIAVTGGRGFIGRAVIDEAADRGITATPLDLPRHDVRTLTAQDIAHYKGVIHLAGRLGTHELFDAPMHAADVNIGGTGNVLTACQDAGCWYVGITMPKVFPSVYTATKIIAGAEESRRHAEGLPVSRVRAFNAYGSGQHHGRGHPQKIVPTFAVEAWAGRPIPIWGDGMQGVDLVDVADVARMLLDAATFGGDETFDAGTGRMFTVNDVAQMVLDITGSKAGTVHLPMRRGEVSTDVVATGEGWDLLGWHPRWNPAAFEAAVLAYRRHPAVIAA